MTNNPNDEGSGHNIPIPKPGKFDPEKFRVKRPQPEQLDLFEWADQQEWLLDPPSYEMGPPSPPPDISELGRDDAVAAMTAWFFTNFEGPEVRTPRDSGEWVYIPHESREELEAAFPQAPEAVIDLAEQEIDEESTGEWVPCGSRMRPEGQRHG